MFEYRYNATDGELLRFDRKKGVYEAYNWREKKWHNSDNAYDAYVGTYDGFLHKITEANANQVIREKVRGQQFDMSKLK
jgi:hypothetical protein